MQILDGTLMVEVIKGSRGDFCVGTLKTSIGDFKVKDAALEQFDRGTYSGRFTIDKVYIENTRWRGGWFTNLMAKVAEDGYQINDEEKSSAPAPSAQAEPDPLDDPIASKTIEKPQATALQAEQCHHELKTAEALNNARDRTSQSTTDPDMQLFGVELYPLFEQRAASIALDNTIDREQFRRQRDRLKAHGYRFDPKTQQWQLGPQR
jgi:hypothetical protein